MTTFLWVLVGRVGFAGALAVRVGKPGSRSSEMEPWGVSGDRSDLGQLLQATVAPVGERCQQFGEFAAERGQ